ncbi:hypothetical protein BDN72DRAFT_957862 [Pluteus cervinus]|uniref:Uncharacterized protein n=1 Tax=Pluteus cervinus TaxID=181527 RepID=A0ACD3B274_9AGAR|nr:hypothetical protein BDN72DRAFT_957862 [Pluteus cervinus]
MAITPAQKTALEEVINALLSITSAPRKRQVAAMFLDLVDRNDWPHYYEVIPEPRCLNHTKTGIEKGRFKDALDVYTDLSLVFWNAVFYNEAGSQIALDAENLKNILNVEWKKRSVLPPPRSESPPPQSPQKIYKSDASSSTTTTTAATQSNPNTATTTTPMPPRRTGTPNATSQSTPYQRPIRPRSSQNQHRRQDSDMDVDVDGTPDPDTDGGGGTGSYDTASVAGTSGTFGASAGSGPGPGSGRERDPDGDELVRQLEKGLIKWPGFGAEGWVENLSPERIIEIVHAVKAQKDVIGNKVSAALEALPEDSTAVLHLSYTAPLSLKLIENKARAKEYTSKQFDLAMAQLFEKGRRWHKPCTEPYGQVLLLQRLYQALTSVNPPLGPPYVSTTNFSALRAGPGNAKLITGIGSNSGTSAAPAGTANNSTTAGANEAEQPQQQALTGVTTFRVSSKDRTFVDELHYKGWSVKLADWVHLSNPDDPSRPVVGQVFRCWVSDEPSKKGQPGITVSWYYRPEQTWHPAERQFWEGEVFKTSHFADHPLPDLIEKIACQFTARHIRGRPRPPFWYLGWPLYVCDSRYHDPRAQDKDKALAPFVKIKNWNSCVPEEVRKSTEFMPIYNFERTVLPELYPSPFLVKGGIKGPGGILEGTSAGAASGGGTGSGGADEDGAGTPSLARTRPRRNVGGGANATAATSNAAGTGAQTRGMTPTTVMNATAAVSMDGTTSYYGASGTNAYGSAMASGTPANATAGMTAMAPGYQYQYGYRSQYGTVGLTQPGVGTSMGAGTSAGGGSGERSVVVATGVTSSALMVEKLSSETAKHFERDPETNEVLWFSAPPVNLPKPTPTRHSLAYIHFLAEKKRKREEREEQEQEQEGRVGEEVTSKSKKQAVNGVNGRGSGGVVNDASIAGSMVGVVS